MGDNCKHRAQSTTLSPAVLFTKCFFASVYSTFRLFLIIFLPLSSYHLIWSIRIIHLNIDFNFIFHLYFHIILYFLFYSVLFSCVLFCSVLFSSVLLCSVLFSPILFWSVLFCSLVFCSVLFCSLLFSSVLYLSFLFLSLLLSSYLFPQHMRLDLHSRSCSSQIWWRNVFNSFHEISYKL